MRAKSMPKALVQAFAMNSRNLVGDLAESLAKNFPRVPDGLPK
jgi:hypothetical protein